MASIIMLDRYMMVIVSGLCLVRTLGVCDWVPDDVKNDESFDGSGRLVVITGDGVPEYDDVQPDHPDLDPALDPELDIDGPDGDVDIDDDDLDIDIDDLDIDDLDTDEPGYHHVWWHHYYHHDEPHLPFPLFPPTFFVHRRPHVRRTCDKWPFECHSTYDVVKWLQCYHEFLHENHPVPLVPVHAWKK